MSSELKHIELKEIIAPQGHALREAKVNDDAFQGLVNSIERQGLINPISVRPAKDEDGKDVFEVVDGLQRFTACQHLELSTVPCHVLSVTDDVDVWEAQIVANEHKINTRPAEFGRAILKIMEKNPNVTFAQMSARLSMTEAKLRQYLSLNKLDDGIKKALDDGEMTLTNAHTLSKLPVEEQGKFLSQALDSDSAEFQTAVAERKKELAEAKRQGKEAGEVTFKPTAKLRNLKVIQEALESKAKFKSTEEALKWVISLDDDSVKAAEEKFNARIKERAERAERKAREREEAKLAKQKEATAKLEAKLAGKAS